MRFSRLTPLALAPTCFGQLDVLAKAKGKYFGSATDNPELSDAAYVSILKSDEFGSYTPGNTQKWQFVEASENVFTFTEGDAIVNLAQSQGKLVRCHTLVWYEELPSWITSGAWTNDTLIAALKNHITQVVKHYEGQCYCWDVVNEAFNEDGTFRQDVFYETIGPDYIRIAFQAAAEADPKVKLYLNDFSIETPGAKATAVQNLVTSLKEGGTKIDGVGLQAHLVAGQTASREELTANLKSFIDLGVEVAYTELDIRINPIPASTSDLEQQSIDYQNTVGACLDAGPGCVGITIWDYTDKYSWVEATFPGAGAACPWDNNLDKKPAYYGIVEALGGNVASSSGAAAPAATTPTAITSTTSSTAKTSTTATSTSTTSTAKRPAVTTSTTTTPTFTTSTIKSPADTTSATKNPTANSSTPTAAPHWGQCGGLTWEGPKTCEPPFNCTPINPWYSQCL